MLCVYVCVMIKEGVLMEYVNVDEVFWSIYIIYEFFFLILGFIFIRLD